jgi:hypothetical protein
MMAPARLPGPAHGSELKKVVELAQQDGAQVLLVGMMISPNYGPAYSDGLRYAVLDATRCTPSSPSCSIT